MHRDWHIAAAYVFVPDCLKQLQRFTVLAEIGAPFMSAGGGNRPFGLFDTPIAKQGLAEPQHAIAVASAVVVKFFQSDLHGAWPERVSSLPHMP